MNKTSGTQAKRGLSFFKVCDDLDLVQGPSLVHYDSLRAFPSFPSGSCYKMHSFIA